MAYEKEMQMHINQLRSQQTQLEAMKDDTKELTELFQAQAKQLFGDSVTDVSGEEAGELQKRGIIKITEGKLPQIHTELLHILYHTN